MLATFYVVIGVSLTFISVLIVPTCKNYYMVKMNISLKKSVFNHTPLKCCMAIQFIFLNK